MAKRVGVEVSIAVADAAKQCNVDVISAYPITPQTHIVEHLSELVADGELDAEFIPVESEHTAMSTCVGGVGGRSTHVYGHQFPGSGSYGGDPLHRLFAEGSRWSWPW